ncbi:MAG: hypothetical protein JNK15_05410, partial [Planctomycetes bacterium]|nr:hypothetical protein [Planctomycetota bacterium]
MLKIAIVAAVLTVPSFAQGWVNRSGLNGPAPRSGHAMGYDAAHGYTVLVGGYSYANGNTTTYDETWTWDGSNWTLRGPAPSTNYTTALAYHGGSNSLLAFTATWNGALNLHALAWTGTAWSTVGTVGSSSSPTAAAYDPIRQETVVYLTPDRVGIWNGTTLTSMTVLAPAVQLQLADDISMAWDPVAGRIVLMGSQLVYGYVNGTWGFTGTYAPRMYEWTGLGWAHRQLTNPPAR